MQKALIEELRRCLAAIEKRDSAREEMLRSKGRLDNLRRPPDLRKYGGGRFSAGAFVITGMVFFALGRALLYEKGLIGGLALFAICLVASILAGAVVGGMTHEKKATQVEENNKQMMERYQANRRENEPRLAGDYQRCREQAYHAEQEVKRLAQDCGLHSSYQEAYCVGCLLRFLETGRSDSLKEAINLYEQEKREDARDEAAERHRREMQRQAAAIYEETVRSADAAEDAARKADAAGLMGAAAMAAACQAAAESKKANQSGEYHVV